ncbi:hypothetical protein WJ69_02865 [Burkholderia ubonensis]|uniref:hypothetical protein n=1 Tax=Burkholderia ubonensis TaxID=101571 RepID=UPI00075429B2|nr:hypothetical protein [Burkholderia ubonensis]KVN96269.1 hypothetical protein WJ69_02865 [Burkholderia ubonensis]
MTPAACATTAFVAVATESHLPLACLALGSIRSSEPIRKRVYVVGSRSVLTGGDGIEVVHAESYVEPALMDRLVSRYTPSEVCFALKPHVLASMLREAGMKIAHYIDSDIKFYTPVDLLGAAFAGGDILLTPHYLRPFPHDGRRPHVLTLLRGGVFNAGYVGVRATPAGFDFLAWWAASVLDYGRNEPRSGMSGDQRWLDLAPALFPTCTVWRHPGANVGYWNLHERTLTQSPDGGIKVDDEPLMFFHFSGFDAGSPTELSKYQDRIDVPSQPMIGRLLGEYAADVASLRFSERRAGHYAYRKWWQGESWLIRRMRNRLRKRW